MIGILTAFFLLLGAASLMIGAVIHNQLEPTMATAMTVPFANLAAVIVALAGLATAFITHRWMGGTRSTRAAMIIGVACVASLMLLFPFAELGYLSRVR
jgi:hypothetical protein